MNDKISCPIEDCKGMVFQEDTFCSTCGNEIPGTKDISAKKKKVEDQPVRAVDPNLQVWRWY